MKRLICESCGSTNIIRTDEYYVCQNCGTKHINDSANKTTAVIDMSPFKDNALINARRARSIEDWEEAERYYDAVEMYSPQNAEAVFYSAYAKAKTALMVYDYGTKDALRIFARDIGFIDEKYTPTDIDAHISLLEDMSKGIMILCERRILDDESIIDLFKAIHTAFCLMLGHIIDSRQYDRYLARLYSMQVKHLEAMIRYGLDAAERSEILEKLEAVHQNWHRIDPMHSFSGFDAYNAQSAEDSSEDYVYTPDKDLSAPKTEGAPKNTRFATIVFSIILVIYIFLLFASIASEAFNSADMVFYVFPGLIFLIIIANLKT